MTMFHYVFFNAVLILDDIDFLREYCLSTINHRTGDSANDVQYLGTRRDWACANVSQRKPCTLQE